MPLQRDAEIAAALAAIMGSTEQPPPAPVGDINARRTLYDAVMTFAGTTRPDFDDVSRTEYHIKASDGHDLLLYWYTKNDAAAKDSPAVLYMHGGGFIALSIGHYDKAMQHYVHETGVPFLNVEFRSAPEFPAPYPVSDSYAALEWLHSNASKLGVDTSRIAIMGDSGGGGVAASLAHYTIKRNGPRIAKQILIYPMLDDRNTVPDEKLVATASWGYNDNQTGWEALLGARCGREGVSPEEAAARMTIEEAQTLPETYIDVGDLDLFRDEDLEYARKLMKAGINTEFHLFPGVHHAAEVIAPSATVSKTMVAHRLNAVKTIRSVKGSGSLL